MQRLVLQKLKQNRKTKFTKTRRYFLSDGLKILSRKQVSGRCSLLSVKNAMAAGCLSMDLAKKGKEEMNDFISNKMKYKTAQGLKIPDMGDDVLMLCVTPKQGLSVVRNYCDCIASPDNPYYNKAEKNAFNFLTNSRLIPYETACELLDRGYLKDAALNSTQGLEHGKELVRKNGRFILDYFFIKCRKKDL